MNREYKQDKMNNSVHENPNHEGISLRPPPFELVTDPIQKQANDNNGFEAGGLLKKGEGDDLYIHWPQKQASGVTLGYGYDLGQQYEETIITDLTNAGFAKSQIDILAKANKDAEVDPQDFVDKYKEQVGPITVAEREKLFQITYTRKEKAAEWRATGSAESKGTAAFYKETPLNAAQWEALHPAIKELLTDMTFQGAYSQASSWGGTYEQMQPILLTEVNDLAKLNLLKAHFIKFRGETSEPSIITRTNVRINFLDKAINHKKSQQHSEQPVSNNTALETSSKEREGNENSDVVETDFRTREPVTRAGFVLRLLQSKRGRIGDWLLAQKSPEKIMKKGKKFTSGSRPLDPITRIEAASMLTRFAGLGSVSYEERVRSFADLQKESVPGWMYDAAHLARLYGVFRGTQDNMFLPEDTLSLGTVDLIIRRASIAKLQSLEEQSVGITAPLH